MLRVYIIDQVEQASLDCEQEEDDGEVATGAEESVVEEAVARALPLVQGAKDEEDATDDDGQPRANVGPGVGRRPGKAGDEWDNAEDEESVADPVVALDLLGERFATSQRASRRLDTSK